MSLLAATNELFRTAPLVMFILSPLYAYIFSSKLAFWLTVGLLINGLIWVVIINIVKVVFPDLAKRPANTSCFYLENNKETDAGGMPSGHCQSMAFFAVWILLCVYSSRQKLDTLVILIYILAMTLIAGMLYSRAYYYECHTWLQAYTGSAIGAITAFILSFYVLTSRYMLL